MKTYTVHTFEDKNGDVILPLPLEVLEKLGWNEGTVLEWKDNGNGSFSLTKKETMLERFKKWLNWKGKSSYSAITMESMTKEEAAVEEAPVVPVVEPVVEAPAVEAPKKVAKKAVAKKAPAKKAAKKKAPKKDK